MKVSVLLVASFLLITLYLTTSIQAADLHVVAHKDNKFDALGDSFTRGVNTRGNNKKKKDDKNDKKKHQEVHPLTKLTKIILPLVKCWFLKKGDTTNINTYNGWEYQYFDTKRTWHQAEKACQVWGGHLVSIANKDENKFVSKLTKNWSWIGLNKESGKWKWADAQKFSYNAWFLFEPNNWGRNENCATNNFLLNGYWHDFNCDLRLGYVCKRNVNQCAWGNSVGEAPAPQVYSEAVDNKIILSVEMAQKASKHVKYAIGFEDYDKSEICESGATSCVNQHLIELGETVYRQENGCEEVFEVHLSMEQFITIAEPSIYELSTGGSVMRSRLYMVYYDGNQETKYYTDIEFYSKINAQVTGAQTQILSSPRVDSVQLDPQGRLVIDLFMSPLDVNMWLSTFRFISSNSGLPYRVTANEVGCASDHLSCGYHVSVSSRQPASDYTDELTLGFQYHLGSLSILDSTFKVVVSYGVQDKLEVDHTPVKA